MKEAPQLKLYHAQFVAHPSFHTLLPFQAQVEEVIKQRSHLKSSLTYELALSFWQLFVNDDQPARAKEQFKKYLKKSYISSDDATFKQDIRPMLTLHGISCN